MSAFAAQRGVGEFDAYGNDSPHLNAFEAEVSRMLGCKDGVFFLTGSMAQQVHIFSANHRAVHISIQLLVDIRWPLTCIALILVQLCY